VYLLLLFGESENFVVNGKELRAVSSVLLACEGYYIVGQQLLGALARK
jgi:hypothetical protein